MIILMKPILLSLLEIKVSRSGIFFFNLSSQLVLGWTTGSRPVLKPVMVGAGFYSLPIGQDIDESTHHGGGGGGRSANYQQLESSLLVCDKLGKMFQQFPSNILLMFRLQKMMKCGL